MSKLEIYAQYVTSSCLYTTLCDGVYVSTVEEMSLQEYCAACNSYCLSFHRSLCTKCPGMIKAAVMIMEKGVCLLSSVFRESFPNATYNATNAKRRLLQLPVVALRIGEASSGNAEIYVMEMVQGVDYIKFQKIFSTFAGNKCSTPAMSKVELQRLLTLAQSDRERELIRYTAFKTSGLTATGATRHFGMQNMLQRSSQVEQCIQEVQSIREAIEEIAEVQASVVSRSMASTSDSDTADEETADEDIARYDHNEHTVTHTIPGFSFGWFCETVVQSRFNWFNVVDISTELFGDVDEQLENYYTEFITSAHSDEEKALLRQSHEAFIADVGAQRSEDRQADALNGMIVTDSEPDDPDDYLQLDLSSQKATEVIERRVKSIHRRARYLKAKQIAEKNFLAKKVSRSVKGVLKDHPDVGEVMEKFVEERNIGADAWRRTGVFTFDGNTRVKEKVTYERLRQHLISVYKRNFSYGTVVQLCIARNRRRKSAQRYKGVAKITSRRARKGFQLKFNPDSHWSGALYRTLNVLQYTDGRSIVNINRDDASGFRLDTMTTHRLHRTPMVKGSDATTTYTDYVNRYKSILQTTSYNFTKTNTTAEVCAGVVKATGVYPKNPTQHMCDLEMLEKVSDIQPVFAPSKSIECIRVDGAADEGPSHEEVQFLWAERHLKKGSIATLVTTRSSGSSFLNRVELQNGCLSLAHSNLFIPSTLAGSCISSETGKLDQQKYARNMDLATDVYISRTDGCPCGDGVIHMFKGADSSQKQDERNKLLVFLKGSKKQKELLKNEHPATYNYFEKVWALKNCHAATNFPSQYIFLVCCLQPECVHPVCNSQVITQLPHWYEGGPPVSCIPLPIPDPDRPWGGSNCDKCKGACYGHFLKPSESLTSSLSPMTVPPSGLLKQAFLALRKYPPSHDECVALSKKVLLSPDQVRMWLEHLHTIDQNRKRGAKRAAATRRKRKQGCGESEDTYSCGICSEPYQDFSDAVQDWIGCDLCDSWFHFVCVGVNSMCVPEKFYCNECSTS